MIYENRLIGCEKMSGKMANRKNYDRRVILATLIKAHYWRKLSLKKSSAVYYCIEKDGNKKTTIATFNKFTTPKLY